MRTHLKILNSKPDIIWQFTSLDVHSIGLYVTAADCFAQLLPVTVSYD